MADEMYSGEKTEPATPRKRKQAREKGQVARSNDLNTAVLLLAASLTIFFLGGHLVTELAAFNDKIFSVLGSGRVTLESVATFGAMGLTQLLLLLLPLVGVLLFLGFAVNLVQIGFLVTAHPVTPNLERLNPIAGLKRIFSRRGLMRLLFGILKLVIVGAILVLGLRALLSPASGDSLYGAMQMPLWEAVSYSNGALFRLGAQASGALLLLALFDLAFQRWQHSKDLMMTKQEVRDELKRMEGDPLLKEHRRKIQQRLALQRMMFDVPDADVVITNPTRIACAVQYDSTKMTAPRLLAKGEGHVAARIREKAIEHRVPVVQEPPLARLIHETTEIGDEIPPDLYQPVAEVLAYVYKLDLDRRSRAMAEVS